MSETVLPLVADRNTPTTGTPLWVRIFHFAIAVLFLALVYSGIVLTYSFSDFSMMSYDLAVDVHEITGIAISVFYVVFVAYAIYSGHWQVYKRRMNSLGQRMSRALGRVFGAKSQFEPGSTDGERRFVAGTQFLLQFQQLAYVVAMVVLMPLLVGTGLAYLYPETAPETAMSLAGLWPLAISHYVAGLLGTLFVVIHIYISTIAGLRRIIFG